MHQYKRRYTCHQTGINEDDSILGYWEVSQNLNEVPSVARNPME
jgi:hypothetical protein